MSNIPLNKLIFDMSSEDYHASSGYSSSQLKDAKNDLMTFYKRYVTKELPRKGSDSFDIGAVVHTGVLEPHKLKSELAVFHKRVRRGAEWEVFKKKNPNKIILTSDQNKAAQSMIDSIRSAPNTMRYISKGKAEVSLYVPMIILDDKIYCNGYVLNYEGWESTSKIIKKSEGIRITLKVRADTLGNDYLQDVKTTSSNVSSDKELEDTVDYYEYDLSAAFYMDVFNAALDQKINSFFWTFVSKNNYQARTVKADADTILIGREKWRMAVLNIAKGISREWKFKDEITTLKPKFTSYGYIKKYTEDKQKKDLYSGLL